MRNFSRPAVLVALALVFLLAFLLGGSENIVDVAAIRRSLGIRIAHPDFTAAMIAVTQTGSAYATLGLGAIAALWLLLRGERGRAYLLAQQSDDGSWAETTRPTGQESYSQRISTMAPTLASLSQ